jgi:hypothetical protein
MRVVHALPRRHHDGAGGALLLVVVAVGVLARLPRLGKPLTPDEAGYAMVAAQWSPGTSLYGDYWVDRPPLLITLFRLAEGVGDGTEAVRLLGLVSVAVSITLAAALARGLGRLDGVPAGWARRVPLLAATTAAVFLASPVAGAAEVDGELLAVPFVLGGLTAVVRARTVPTPGSTWWWAVAGVLAVAAVAVKQNTIEVFLAAAVALAVAVRRRALPVSGALVPVAAFAAGAVASGAALLGWAALHGTGPAGLWDAVVTFRVDAAPVIARSAPRLTSVRAADVAAAFLGSGALALVAAGLAPGGPQRRPAGPPGAPARAPSATTGGWLAVVVLAWEAFGVAAGGTYSSHYLVGLVPGLVLATVVAASGTRLRRVALAGGLAWAAAVAAVGLAVGVVPVTGEGLDADDLGACSYLVRHARPGDTGVVAFGHPELLRAAHLSSPYAELWSLPVRVRDPHLDRLTAILRGPDRPTWIVVDGGSLRTWGVDASTARRVVQRHYRPVHTVGHWRLLHVRP